MEKNNNKKITTITILTILLILLLLFFSKETKALTNISSCGTINISNEFYNLTSDLQGANCIFIDAENITFEGNNHIITNNGTSSDYAIYVNKTNGNITIKNLYINLTTGRYGIRILNGGKLNLYNLSVIEGYIYSYGIYGIGNGYLENISLTNPTKKTQIGIQTNSIGSITINNSHFENLSYGIYGTSGGTIKLINSTIKNCDRGFYFGGKYTYLDYSYISNCVEGIRSGAGSNSNYAPKYYNGTFSNNNYDFYISSANYGRFIETYNVNFNYSKNVIPYDNYIKVFDKINFFNVDIKNVSLRNENPTNSIYYSDGSSLAGYFTGVNGSLLLEYKRINASGIYPTEYLWRITSFNYYANGDYYFNTTSKEIYRINLLTRSYGGCVNINENGTYYYKNTINSYAPLNDGYDYCLYINESNVKIYFNDYQSSNNYFLQYPIRIGENDIGILIGENLSNISLYYANITNYNNFGLNTTSIKILENSSIKVYNGSFKDTNNSFIVENNSFVKTFYSYFLDDKNIIKGYFESIKKLGIGIQHNGLYKNLSYVLKLNLDNKTINSYSNNLINFYEVLSFKANNSEYNHSINNILNVSYINNPFVFYFNFSTNNSYYRFGENIFFDVNFVPLVENLSLEPVPLNFTVNNFSCNYDYFDKDNDSLKHYIFWYKNGFIDSNLSNLTTILINNSYFNVYDNLSCEVYVEDYKNKSNILKSNNITINNTKPIINEFYISYNNITDEYVCNLDYTDYDDDTNTVFEMFVDNISVGFVNKISNPGNFSNIKCQVNITDTDTITAITTYLYGDVNPPIVYFVNMPSKASITDKVFIQAYCKDLEDNIAYGYPKVSWVNPNGIIEGNFTLYELDNKPDYYGRYYTFSIVGEYTNFTVYCKDGNSNLAENTTNNLIVSYPATTGGGGDTTIINENKGKIKIEYNDYIKVYYNIKKYEEIKLINQGYEEASITFSIDTKNTDEEILPYVRFENSKQTMTIKIPENRGLKGGEEYLQLQILIPESVPEKDYNLVLKYYDSYGNNGIINIKVGVYENTGFNTNIAVIGIIIFISGIAYLVLRMIKN